ncbi:MULTISPECIES: hypothetical protein [unclassified Rhizobium]|uniref:hypothetical protein n=1 Tax=unclassified Rhizobium TaxID=2613769 RepID=UPI00288BEFDB|nr:MULTISPECIES: hypothetical protein [unclassified Rhizobium]
MTKELFVHPSAYFHGDTYMVDVHIRSGEGSSEHLQVDIGMLPDRLARADPTMVARVQAAVEKAVVLKGLPLNAVANYFAMHFPVKEGGVSYH